MRRERILPCFKQRANLLCNDVQEVTALCEFQHRLNERSSKLLKFSYRHSLSKYATTAKESDPFLASYLLSFISSFQGAPIRVLSFLFLKFLSLEINESDFGFL
jgi:hypothetical protein